MLTFYGLGTILGAGIYVLVGKVSLQAGLYAPLAFLLASFIAFFTAVSYAELSSSFPKSAGEAFYVRKAFKQRWLSSLVGWFVIFTGLVSAAALTRGFVGYLHVFVAIPPWISILLLVLLMGSIAIWGIRISAAMIMGITVIEVSGLLIIIALASSDWSNLVTVYHASPKFDLSTFTGILSGAFLAFYAYIGFEDMVNVAEEVRHPEKSLPLAIFWALGLATILYLLVSLAVIAALPLEKLMRSDAPLAVFIENKGYSPALITLISLIAIINGAMVQLIMASRVIYGMAKQGNAPQFFARVNTKTKTPIPATVFVMFIILALALWLNVSALAKITSAIILFVFIMVHMALIRLKLKKKRLGKGADYSIFFPIMGIILSLLFLLTQLLWLG